MSELLLLSWNLCLGRAPPRCHGGLVLWYRLVSIRSVMFKAYAAPARLQGLAAP
ncbi:MAG: hypothetical protein OXC54_10560 [Rhodospirillaceae bacterium]|nr:hypothetical protein [Rhodospirillaceae bacterium]